MFRYVLFVVLMFGLTACVEQSSGPAPLSADVALGLDRKLGFTSQEAATLSRPPVSIREVAQKLPEGTLPLGTISITGIALQVEMLDGPAKGQMFICGVDVPQDCRLSAADCRIVVSRRPHCIQVSDVSATKK